MFNKALFLLANKNIRLPYQVEEETTKAFKRELLSC